MASQSGRVETFWRTREDVFSFRSGRGNGSGNSSLQRTMVQRKRHRAEDDRDVFSQIQGLPEITPSEAYRQSCQKDRSSVLIEKKPFNRCKTFYTGKPLYRRWRDRRAQDLYIRRDKDCSGRTLWRVLCCLHQPGRWCTGDRQSQSEKVADRGMFSDHETWI